MTSLNARVALGNHQRLVRRNRMGPAELLQTPMFTPPVPRAR